jgi:hypothetical protein
MGTFLNEQCLGNTERAGLKKRQIGFLHYKTSQSLELILQTNLGERCYMKHSRNLADMLLSSE